jgi:dipeptidyl aminopeptidase/acylaminoacyl peptidase
MSMRRLVLALIFLAGGWLASLGAQGPRLLTVDDLFAIKTVGEPRISPDGQWVAYTVTQMDAKTDTADTDVWMAPLDGGAAVRLTTSEKAESRPRWSPDGRYLAFLSSRDGEKTQVWLLPRAGGEAFRLTDYKGGVSSFEWSPDGSRLAVVAADPDPDEAPPGQAGAGAKAPKPIVVTRLQFKRDGVGYLTDRRDHVYVFDVEKRTSVQITSGPYDDRSPVWSPDGRTIAFVSNRTPEPDANQNTDLFVVAAEAGAAPRALTTWPGEDTSPAFTPDGRALVYVQGGDPKDVWYDTNDVAVVSVEGGPPRLLAPALDRNVSDPTPSPDGRFVYFTLEDAGNVHLARVALAGGAVERVVAGERDIVAFDVGPKGELVVLESQPQYPPEVFAVRDGRLSRVTHVNDELLAGLRVAPVERFRAKSRDGTLIDAFLTRPPGLAPGTRVPTLLRIHGGPVSQFSTRFNFEWQLFAAHGYAVVGANPRGSSGRGREFSRAIFADWGNKDFEDVMAAVDQAIAMGVADPERLGVGGWSYGGILTNYVITKTNRFKAAISGASEVNYTANYGHDHYQRQWEAELGLPWRNVDLWVKLSPFFQVERITTPTLVMCGQQDWNVPLQNSEQLYQALRRLGRETQLVIYPGQSHSIRRPSYQKDRYERYLAWYDKYLKPTTTTPPAGKSGQLNF